MNKTENGKIKSMMLAGSALAAAVLFSAFFAPEQAQAAKKEQRIDAVSYHMNLKLDTKKDRLYETVTVRVKNHTDKYVSRLCLRNMNPALLKIAKNTDYAANKGKKSRLLSVTRIGSKKKLKIMAKQGRTVLYVNLGKKEGIRPGQSGTFTIRMWTDIPDRQDRFSIRKTAKGKLYELSFCFPYLADYENGKWITDPCFDDGESRSFDLADYDVTFKAPKSYQVAATGSSHTQNGKTRIHAANVRDFAITACNFMAKDSFTVKGIRVNSYYLKGSRYLKKYRKLTRLTAKDSIRLFTEQIGRCPEKELDIVPGLFGMAFGGMEYPGLVMVNVSEWFDGSYYDAFSLGEDVSHEIGHQWFYSAVGNREYTEGWIDEGFASYLQEEIFDLTPGAANTYMRKIDSFTPSIAKIKKENRELLATAREDYAGMKINTPPDRYPQNQEYGVGEYEEACMFLREVRGQMGKKRFGRFLKKYYKTYAGKTVKTKDVLKLIRSYDNSKKMKEIIRFYCAKA